MNPCSVNIRACSVISVSLRGGRPSKCLKFNSIKRWGELFSKNLYNQIYDNRNSFGKTYGEHREFLEFDKNQYIELMEYANKKDILFLVTPFDISSVDFLEEINVQAYKIASGDLNNIPLQKRILEFQWS